MAGAVVLAVTALAVVAVVAVGPGDFPFEIWDRERFQRSSAFEWNGFLIPGSCFAVENEQKRMHFLHQQDRWTVEVEFG